MSLKSILEEQKKVVRPSYEEARKLEQAANKFITALKKKGVTARIGGSLAKGTLIQKEGTQDVDIFAVFENEQAARTLGKTMQTMKLPGSLRTVHGSRDYYQISCEDAILEIVPVVGGTKKDLIENVTDFSLGHVSYITKKLAEKPELADEIRLAKTFCVAQRVYGAESYIHGFSGYALEVLILHFGSFIKFLRGIAKKHVIDPEKHFRTERNALEELNGSKLVSPIILIDPTYQYRNALAGLRTETFERFQLAAKRFLKHPSLDFFRRKPLDVEELEHFAKKRRARLITLALKTDRQEGDIAGTKMKKLFDFYTRELIRLKQTVLRKEFDYEGTGQAAIGYVIVKESPEIIIKGPSKNMGEDVIEQFKQAKGERAFQKKGSWWYTKKVTLDGILESVQSVQKEIGATIRLLQS